MNLLSEINIPRAQGGTVIQLLQGDLSAIPAEQATDILVMSAFPGNYTPLQGSLICALEDKGLSVKAMALEKEVDLLKQLHCWLSKPLSVADQQKFNFKHILCFEPGNKIKEPEEVVGDIFRCINTFAFDEDKNDLAMPIIATGYQKIPLQKIVPALLDACFFWLKNGLPIKSIKLVVHRPEQADEALLIFDKFKNGLEAEQAAQQPARGMAPQPAASAIRVPASAEKPGGAEPKKGYDYFLSYAHVHSKEVQHFVDELKNKNNSLAVFYDKDSIPAGGLWIKEISAAIQQADKVLVFLSPDYDNSPVCWDEFQCAKLMEYNRKKSIIQTVYLYGYKETEMPPIMGIYSYIDCREGSTEKLDAAIQQLLK
jgi:TIR domain